MPLSAQAARLDVSTPVSEVKIGDTFTVNLSVGDVRQPFNAVSGTVTFPQNELEVTALSKTGSILSLFVQEPSYSNVVGTVQFEGIALDEQAMQTGGRILSITFRAKAPGLARVRFVSGSVLANDGAGTNTLTNLGLVELSVGGTQAEASVRSDQAPSSPRPVRLSSPTHPDQAKWYANNTAEFSWSLPEGALEVRTLLNRSPDSMPTVSSIPPVSKKKVNGLPAGTSYFHVQARTADGWQDTQHFRVNIDTVAPKPFEILFPEGEGSFHTSPLLQFQTTDDGSGLGRYEVVVGGGEPVMVDAVADGVTYALPSLQPGSYAVEVTAIDRAENRTAARAVFTIDALDTPTITGFQEMITQDDPISLSGTTYGDATVTLFVNKNGDPPHTFQVQSTPDGTFQFHVKHDLPVGAYTLHVRVVDASGAQSLDTPGHTIQITPGLQLVAWRFWNVLGSGITIAVFAVVLVLFVLAFAILLPMLRKRRKERVVRRRHQHAQEVFWVVEKITSDLRARMDERMATLQNERVSKKLAEKEIQYIEVWRNDLAQLEEITREVSHRNNEK